MHRWHPDIAQTLAGSTLSANPTKLAAAILDQLVIGFGSPPPLAEKAPLARRSPDAFRPRRLRKAVRTSMTTRRLTDSSRNVLAQESSLTGISGA